MNPTKRFAQALFLLALGAGFSAPGARAANVADDQFLTNGAGQRFIISGWDGVLRQLLPQHVPTNQPAPVPPGSKPPFVPCNQTVITKATGPDRVMLDEEGWITPVQDQGGRGSCDTFAATEALESAYLVEYYKMSSDEFTKQYGHPLLLSEQYMLTIKNETHLADHDSGSATTNLERLAPYCGSAPAYGMPLATEWPYIPSDTTVMEMMMPVVPGAPVDTTGFANFTAAAGTSGAVTQNPNPPPPTTGIVLSATSYLYGISMDLIMDLADYSWNNIPAATGASAAPASFQSIYPPQSVHEAALWAPTKTIDVALPRSQNLAVCGNQPMSSFTPVTSSNTTPSGGAPAGCYEALAAPLEQLLSENHAMAIGINTGAWKFNSTTGAYQYNAAANENPLSDDHDVLLVGYDRTKQLFKIKNSWGTNWGGNGGFFYATYDYLLRTIGDAVYVDAVRDPNEGAVPNGIWRGFWQGKLAGVSGVAVIHHVYGTQSNDLETPAGTFYGNNGSQTDLNFLDWGIDPTTKTYTAYFGDASSRPLFSLTMQEGSVNPMAELVNLSGQSEGQWSKCQSFNAPNPDVVPYNYGEAAYDPYVLPPCVETPAWHVAPTWSCPQGGEYVDQIRYTYDGGTLNTTRAGCLKTSETAPSCPSGYMLAPDILGTASGDRSATGDSPTVSPTAPSWQDVCGIALPILEPGFVLTRSNLGCDPSTTDVSKGGCPLPTCAAPKSVFGLSGAMLTLGSTENGVWAVAGWDKCVTEAYAAVAGCPAGYAVSPNGNDCLRYVAPPQPK